jgi:hypothetical protein
MRANALYATLLTPYIAVSRTSHQLTAGQPTPDTSHSRELFVRPPRHAQAELQEKGGARCDG